MPNKIYTTRETAVNFKPSGGSAAFNVQRLSAGSGYLSARLDRGATSASSRCEWRAKTQVSGAATVGDGVEMYLCTSDGTMTDGDFGASETGITSLDKRRNLRFVGSLVADTTSTSGVLSNSGRVVIDSRYVSVVWYNLLSVPLSPLTTVHEFALTPIPDEIQ